MVTPAVHIIIKMIEQLPEADQEKIAEHLREYLAEMEDEEKWNEWFSRTQDKLIYAAREARKQIAEGKSEPLNSDTL